MPELRRGVDPFQLDLLQRPAADLWVKRLSQSENPLLDTGDGSLDHDVVVLDLAISDKAAHSGDKKVLLASFVWNKLGGWRSWAETYGVICFFETSNSVEALPSSEPLPIR